MHRFLAKGHTSLSGKALLLLAFIALGVGLVYLAANLIRSTRVTELTGLIGTRHHSGPLAFSPDGKTLALPKRDGRVELWDLKTRRGRSLVSAFNRAKTPADHVAFSAGGRLLAVYYRDTGVAVWDIAAAKEQTYIPIPRTNRVDAITFADDDRVIITIIQDIESLQIKPGPVIRTGEFLKVNPKRWEYSAIRWEVATGKQHGTHAFDPLLRFEVLSPDGRYAVLTNETLYTTDETVTSVFDLMTGQKAFIIKGPGHYVFSDDGSVLVSFNGTQAARDQVTLWNVPSGRLARRFILKHGNRHSTNHLALSPNQRILAIGQFRDTHDENHDVGLISLESGKILATFACGPPKMICDVVRFSPDGRLLATDTFRINIDDQRVNPLLKFWKIPASW